jgi:hypothetical protein
VTALSLGTSAAEDSQRTRRTRPRAPAGLFLWRRGREARASVVVRGGARGGFGVGAAGRGRRRGRGRGPLAGRRAATRVRGHGRGLHPFAGRRTVRSAPWQILRRARDIRRCLRPPRRLRPTRAHLPPFRRFFVMATRLVSARCLCRARRCADMAAPRVCPCRRRRQQTKVRSPTLSHANRRTLVQAGIASRRRSAARRRAARAPPSPAGQHRPGRRPVVRLRCAARRQQCFQLCDNLEQPASQ